ncbi:MAG: crotonase, partial [Pseudomonadota bacterium]|nr:crotonase [Pseudomonadota bacterium]
LGIKSGRGFYFWKKGQAQKTEPTDKEAPPDLKARLMLRLLNEAIACLREGIVEDADLLDAGVIFGTGFAPFRGGPAHYLRETGQQKLLRELEGLEERYGKRFHPDPGWKSLLI